LKLRPGAGGSGLFFLKKSGKTTIIATTEGNMPLPGHEGIKLGLNLYKSRK